jgi:hypothetical protein
MDDQFEAVEARTGGAVVPDGDYEGLIQRFDFWERDGGGPLKLITEISVDAGEYAGMSAPSVWHELEDPDRIGWTKGYLEMLGLKGVKLSDLEAALESLAGATRVEIRVTSTLKNGKTYRNTYVNEVLAAGQPAAAVAPPAEDDIPF